MRTLLALLLTAGLAWGGVCEKEVEYANIISDGSLCITNSMITTNLNWAAVAISGKYTVTDPDVLDDESRTNCVEHWAKNGQLWETLGGTTGIVCTVTSEVTTNETETDNRYWPQNHIYTTDMTDTHLVYTNGLSYPIYQPQASPAPRKTVTTTVKRVTTLKFAWRGETWTAQDVEVLCETTKHYKLKEDWIEE